ncbi:MAG: hypothetical protein ACHP6I_02815 [Rickettsiales bacterium]
MKIEFFFRFLLVIAPLLSFSLSANAVDTELEDASIISNLLKYTHGENRPPHKMAVLFNPDSADSKTEAESFLKDIMASSDAKKTRIEASLVPINELEGKSEFNSAYIANGLKEHQNTIYEFAKSNKVLTLSLDMACAMTDCCVIAIENGPSINIYLNEKNLAAFGLNVDAAFKLMVKRV